MAVSRAISAHLPAAKKAAGDEDPDIDAILAAIDFGGWDDLATSIQPDLESTARETVASVFASLDLSQTGDIFELSDQFAFEYALNRGAELVGKKWVDGVLVDNPNAQWAITETTRAELRDLISESFVQEWSPAELAKQIDQSFVFSSGRAEMIARTETAFAQTAASVNTATNLGAETKTVQLSNIHDVDDECDDAQAAGEVPIDEAYPGGALHVPLHPRCMCVELLHVPKPKKKGEDDGE